MQIWMAPGDFLMTVALKAAVVRAIRYSVMAVASGVWQNVSVAL